MHLIEILFLAAALGVDCLVVSFSQGLVFTRNRTKNSLALAFTMGLSQGIMPCAGYFFTGAISRYIEPYAKWLVFIIFFILGAKLIYEAFNQKDENICCIDFKCLIGMGLATSIDALASGVSLNLTKTPLMLSVLIIGFMSFLMSVSGFWLGNFFKKLPSKYLEISGGIILILLAFKNVFI